MALPRHAVQHLRVAQAVTALRHVADERQVRREIVGVRTTQCIVLAGCGVHREVNQVPLAVVATVIALPWPNTSCSTRISPTLTRLSPTR